ncbi:AAA family ATPase [Nocardioides sp. L-11A]|uniref:AAA family ATPase n=1 Tax=Nocardioides sp. L-11A TaxID=3043848 RepID=UPI002499CE31|nr:AAA family ATPase [Nocardioides sp. L-11A]
MLRGLNIASQWRSLAPGFWPKDVPFGKRTIVYGHNGSGKSTIADLLLALADEGAPVDTSWEDEGGTSHRVARGAIGPATGMAVFTKRWVEENLSAFLDGESASAIVTLGREAISAKEEEERLAEEITALTKSAKEFASKAKEHDKKAEALAREVQNLIVAELEDVDRRRFTKHRYQLPTVKANLAGFKGEVPSAADHAAALMRLGEGAPEKIPTPRAMPDAVTASLSDMDALLSETPTRQALASLEGHPEAQRWVEEGRELHEDESECLFCASPLTKERREALAKHFDESWVSIRARARTLRERVSQEARDLAAWVNEWPDSSLIASEHRPGYQEAVEAIQAAVATRSAVLEAVEVALSAKELDPSATLTSPDLTLLGTPPSTTAADELVTTHNEQADDHDRIRTESINTVLDHLVGSHSARFLDHKKQVDEASEKGTADTRAASVSESALRRIREQRLTTSETARRLTEDLSRVFGRGHLSVRVTDDGKSYTCWRGGQAATHLSDGERTTLSLLYFLRQLEDESHKADPGQRIVVIDDPSSSLDRESVFATHQWLVSALENAGQFILFTHDFNLLRLFLKSQKNQWDTSFKKLKNNDPDETRYPRVAFVECFASNQGGQRQTRIAPLPDLLRKSTSEYAYLFSMIMKGLAEPSDHERLFLLPNAARRVLESFASYRTPDLSHFDKQLEAMIEEPELQPYRDVYDFCNRWSHGEGSEAVDVLDARAVYNSVRRCMEFLRAADSDHFARLCKATSVDANVLR